jgi:O-antigen/teichoic acid export membrane protein
MTEYKLFAQRIGLIGIVNIVSALSGFILLPILTKTLSTELYGIWVQIVVTSSLLTLIATLQLNNAIIRFFAGEKDVNKIRGGFYSVFALVFLINLLIILIILVLSKPLAITFFGGEEAIPFVRLLCFIVPSSALNAICIEFFRAFQQVKKYAGFLLLQPILTASLISYAVLSGYSLLGALAALIIVNTFSLFLSFFSIRSQIGIGKPDLSVLKPYLVYCLPLVPSVAGTWIIEISDRYVISYFLGVASVGIYSAAYVLGSMVGMFMSPIGTILLPTISNLYENNKMEELKIHLKYSLKLFLMFAIPSLFGLTVLSKSLLLTFTTSEYVSAYLVVPIVALGTIFYVSTGICSIILAVVKKNIFVWHHYCFHYKF